jgi:hypothetical protein
MHKYSMKSTNIAGRFNAIAAVLATAPCLFDAGGEEHLDTLQKLRTASESLRQRTVAGQPGSQMKSVP